MEPIEPHELPLLCGVHHFSFAQAHRPPLLISVDVALTHIDTNGDGVITRAEVKDAVVFRHSAAAALAMGGCAAGALVYLAIRFALKRRGKAPAPVHHVRHAIEAPAKNERRRRIG